MSEDGVGILLIQKRACVIISFFIRGVVYLKLPNPF